MSPVYLVFRYGSESESSTFQLKMIHAIDFFKKVSVTSAPHFKHIEVSSLVSCRVSVRACWLKSRYAM